MHSAIHHADERLLDGHLTAWGGAAAWLRGDTSPSEWRVGPGPGAMSEIRRATTGGVAWSEVSRAALAEGMPASALLMGALRERLDAGPGVAVLAGLPLEGLTDDACAVLAGALCSLLAPVVAQTHDGVRLYQVRDTGCAPGPGVRRSLTNVGQPFHTDGPWLEHTAHYIALMCVRPGAIGGVSRLASLAAAHDRLLVEAPDALARLYGTFWWDRQREHGPDEALARELPVFEFHGGRRRARHYADYVRNGHPLAGQVLDDAGEAALARLDAVLEAHESNLELSLRGGEMLLLDNRRLVHARTAFDDITGNPGPRQMIRVWMRSEGGAALEG